MDTGAEKNILTYRLEETGKMLAARGVESEAHGSDGELVHAKCQANKMSISFFPD